MVPVVHYCSSGARTVNPNGQPFPMFLLFMLRRKEDRGETGQLLFPSPFLIMTGWRGGVKAGRKEYINIGLMLE